MGKSTEGLAVLITGRTERDFAWLMIAAEQHRRKVFEYRLRAPNRPAITARSTVYFELGETLTAKAINSSAQRAFRVIGRALVYRPRRAKNKTPLPAGQRR